MSNKPVLDRIVATADKAYGDNLIRHCHEQRDCGDFLALFVARELASVCDGPLPDSMQWRRAVQVVRSAASQLNLVADALEKRAEEER